MINRADKAALLPVQKIHSLAGIYTGVNKRLRYFSPGASNILIDSIISLCHTINHVRKRS